MIRWGTRLLALLIVTTALPAAAASDPRALIKEVTERTFEQVESSRAILEQDPGQLDALVEGILMPHFDFDTMARSTLGKHWRKATPVQRERFTAAYRMLLVRTYATALLDYGDEQVEYLPMSAAGDASSVTVRTEIEQPGGLALPINYRMHLVEDRWLVFDVTIEGVSLTANYRTTFSGEIRRIGLDDMIDRIETRNRQDGRG